MVESTGWSLKEWKKEISGNKGSFSPLETTSNPCTVEQHWWVYIIRASPEQISQASMHCVVFLLWSTMPLNTIASRAPMHSKNRDQMLQNTIVIHLAQYLKRLIDIKSKTAVVGGLQLICFNSAFFRARKEGYVCPLCVMSAWISRKLIYNFFEQWFIISVMYQGKFSVGCSAANKHKK